MVPVYICDQTPPQCTSKKLQPGLVACSLAIIATMCPFERFIDEQTMASISERLQGESRNRSRFLFFIMDSILTLIFSSILNQYEFIHVYQNMDSM